jgi:hypothetical protein
MTLTQETDYPPISTIRVRNAKAVQSPLRVSTENGTQATEFRLNSPWIFSTHPSTSSIQNVLLWFTAQRFW